MKRDNKEMKFAILEMIMAKALELPEDPTCGMDASIDAISVGVDVIAGMSDCIEGRDEPGGMLRVKALITRRILINLMAEFKLDSRDMIGIIADIDSDIDSDNTLLHNLKTGDMNEH